MEIEIESNQSFVALKIHILHVSWVMVKTSLKIAWFLYFPDSALELLPGTHQSACNRSNGRPGSCELVRFPRGIWCWNGETDLTKSSQGYCLSLQTKAQASWCHEGAVALDRFLEQKGASKALKTSQKQFGICRRKPSLTGHVGINHSAGGSEPGSPRPPAALTHSEGIMDQKNWLCFPIWCAF